MSIVPLTARNVEEQILLNLKALLVDTDKHEIKVGIPGGKVNDGNEIAYYAAQNEFGVISQNIPSRPALRTTVTRYKDEINRGLAIILKEFVNQNRDAMFFMNKMGLFVAGLFKKNITEGKWIPNSPVTIARKKSNKPLIDKGAYRQAATSWVIKK
jgi:hypothetical protein